MKGKRHLFLACDGRTLCRSGDNTKDKICVDTLLTLVVYGEDDAEDCDQVPLRGRAKQVAVNALKTQVCDWCLGILRWGGKKRHGRKACASSV